MSTNARIGIERPGINMVESIYTHWDGYPSHHGPILLDHYNTRDAVDALVALGDLSTLAEEIGEAHNFDCHGDVRKFDPWCLAYGRDRGETDVASVVHSPTHWPDGGQEYEYLFLSDNRWVWREVSYTEDDGHFVKEWGKWQPLTPADCIDPREA